jgi:hypothetical protein
MIAPFPYFGGKSVIAHEVWTRFGDVANYVEPFAGSLAVLLNRPHPAKIETINDLDGLVTNFWRALQHDPEGVARHATNPVNECDLHARHAYLLKVKPEFEARLCGDPEFYDSKLAGWWAWGTSCWIGSGLCSGEGAWQSVDGMLVKLAPRTGNKKKLPHLGTAGTGVTKQLPHLGDAGKGVTKQLPHLGDAGKGDEETAPGPFDPSVGLLDWMYALANRIRTVRVCCGDWTRVLGPSVTSKFGLTGIFLDPPYGHDMRAAGLYANDSVDVTAAVGEWCKSNGNNNLLRIALAGYEGEYDLPGWKVMPWKARGGMGNQGAGRGRDNASLERIWFSPYCLGSGLFDE